MTQARAAVRDSAGRLPATSDAGSKCWTRRTSWTRKTGQGIVPQLESQRRSLSRSPLAGQCPGLGRPPAPGPEVAPRQPLSPWQLARLGLRKSESPFAGAGPGVRAMPGMIVLSLGEISREKKKGEGVGALGGRKRRSEEREEGKERGRERERERKSAGEKE